MEQTWVQGLQQNIQIWHAKADYETQNILQHAVIPGMQAEPDHMLTAPHVLICPFGVSLHNQCSWRAPTTHGDVLDTTQLMYLCQMRLTIATAH